MGDCYVVVVHAYISLLRRLRDLAGKGTGIIDLEIARMPSMPEIDKRGLDAMIIKF